MPASASASLTCRGVGVLAPAAGAENPAGADAAAEARSDARRAGRLSLCPSEATSLAVLPARLGWGAATAVAHPRRQGGGSLHQEAPALRRATPCFRTERRGAWLSWEAPCFPTERRGGEAPCRPKGAERAVAPRLAALAQGGAMFPYGKAGADAGRCHRHFSARAGGGTREWEEVRRPKSEGKKGEAAQPLLYSKPSRPGFQIVILLGVS